MRRDHLDAVLAQLLIEWIAVVGPIADQILRLGLDHVEVEAQLYQPNFVVVARQSRRLGDPRKGRRSRGNERQIARPLQPLQWRTGGGDRHLPVSRIYRRRFRKDKFASTAGGPRTGRQ